MLTVPFNGAVLLLSVFAMHLHDTGCFEALVFCADCFKKPLSFLP